MVILEEGIPYDGLYPGLILGVLCLLRRICERSGQPKIEIIADNAARLILLKKLNGSTT